MAEVSRVPLPAISARITRPVAHVMGRRVGVTEARVQADVEGLPRTLDHVDELIERGVLAGPELNAADLQVLSSVRSLQTFPELRPLIEGRPACEAAERLIPPLPGPVPATLPRSWLDRAQELAAAADKEPHGDPDRARRAADAQSRDRR